MRQKILSVILGTSFLLAGTGAGYASDTKQRVGNRTSQPIGHYEYCLANQGDCSIRAFTTKPVTLTRKRWKEMLEANNFANSTIEPVTDFELYGVEEFWTLPKSFGDCEDYVLMKRQYLMSLGWPASSLLATVVLQPNGEGHAVLTVRTDRADYVLDNLRDQILSWNETDYKFLKRVSARHSGHWEDILDSRLSVASIKRPKGS